MFKLGRKWFFLRETEPEASVHFPGKEEGLSSLGPWETSMYLWENPTLFGRQNRQQPAAAQTTFPEWAKVRGGSSM